MGLREAGAGEPAARDFDTLALQAGLAARDDGRASADGMGPGGTRPRLSLEVEVARERDDHAGVDALLRGLGAP